MHLVLTMRVALFVTCLADLYRPQAGFAAVRLLESAGCRVEAPVQTCCGQPAYNNGDFSNARAIARQVIEAFGGYRHVVVPSGSCAGMLKVHYPRLFAEDPRWCERARDLSGRTHELLSFLHDVLEHRDFGACFSGCVAYHDSCSSLREIGVQRQARELLSRVTGLRLAELKDSEVCCGFGGTFCVKYPELSARMVDDKARSVQATGADALLAGDLGCLLNIAGRLRRIDSKVRVYHAAEVLAGMADGPGIGDRRHP